MNTCLSQASKPTPKAEITRLNAEKAVRQIFDEVIPERKNVPIGDLSDEADYLWLV